MIALSFSRTLVVLCHNPNVSAGDMVPAKSFKVLLQAEFQHPLPRVAILAEQYERVAEFVFEEKGLDWVVLLGSGLLASVVEMAVT